MQFQESAIAPPLQTFLAGTSLWRDLPPEEITFLAEIVLPQTYRKGEALFWEGDEGRGFFIVMTGRVEVFKQSEQGKKHILQLFGPGEHFAEVPALDGERYPASAVAVERSRVLFFPRAELLALLQRRPEFAANLLAVFARRLRLFARQIEDLSLREVSARLAAYLLDRAGEPSDPDAIACTGERGDDGSFDLGMTKTQLAATLGTIPETLSRALSRLERQGAIALRGGSRVRPLDGDALAAIAAGRKLDLTCPAVDRDG